MLVFSYETSNKQTLFSFLTALHSTLKLPVRDSAVNFTTPNFRTYVLHHQQMPQTVVVTVVYQAKKQ
jgi:hypothetical protein